MLVEKFKITSEKKFWKASDIIDEVNTMNKIMNKMIEEKIPGGIQAIPGFKKFGKKLYIPNKYSDLKTINDITVFERIDQFFPSIHIMPVESIDFMILYGDF